MRNNGVSAKAINPTAIGRMVKIKKKVDIEYSALILSIRLPVAPASQFPIAVHVNQTPNINPTSLAGANLLTYDNPTGEVLGATTNGLVGYWNFDEGTGTTAGDSSGRGNTGTLVNGPTWVAGKVGSGAVQFDGGAAADDFVNAGSANILDNLS